MLSDDKSVFGDIVPSIYINRITLENGGQVFRPDKYDRVLAHTDRKAPTHIVEAIQNKMEEYYEEYNYPIPSDKNLKITVDYAVKDAINGSIGELLSTWSNDGDLQKYTNVYFVLVDSPLASKILSVGSNIDMQNNKSILKSNLLFAVIPLAEQNLLEENEKQKLISMGLASSTFEMPYTGLAFSTGANLETVSSQMLSFVEKSTVAVEKASLKDILIQSSLSSDIEIDDDGKKIKNYRFRRVYNYDATDSPKNLSIVAACSMDLQNLEETFGLDLSFLKTASTTVGKRVVQNIFRKGKIVSTNYVYMLKSNSQIWTGQVYKINGSFYTTSNPASGQELVKKAVKSSKVQDFRITEELQRLKFDLSNLQNNEFSLAEANKVTRDKTDTYKSPPHFSKNYISRDFDGNARFMFGIDYYSLVRDLTMFGSSLPKTPANVYALLAHRQYAKILNMSVKRKRVELVPRSNRLGTYNAKEIPFKTGYLGEPRIDAEEAISVISAGSEQIGPNGVGTFSSNPSTNINSLKEISIRAPDLNLETGILGFRYFSGDDFEVKSFTDGKYQYGIEMEILDRSHLYIMNSVVSLIKVYKALSIYYTESSTPSVYYDVRTGRFKKALANLYAHREAAAKAANQPVIKPWMAAANILVDIINKYKLESATFDMESTKDQLILISNPTSGSPRGVETLLNLILNAASKLTQVVGGTLSASTISQIAAGSNKIAISADTILSSTPDKRIIKVTHWVDDVFDTEVPRRFGYDFLTPTGNSSVSDSRGLTKIPGAVFNGRLKQEMLKYFNVANPSSFDAIGPTGQELTTNDTIYSTLFSYLSPAAVNLGVSSGGDTEDNTGRTPPYYSLLNGSTPFQGNVASTSVPTSEPFYDRIGYSYIATKIMSYNYTSNLPPYDTTINQNTNTLLSQGADKIKYHTQQILTNRNCVAVMDNVLQGRSSAPSDFTGLFMSEYLGNEVDITDALINNIVTLTEVKDDPLSISYKGGAEVSTFLSFVYGDGERCGGLATTKKPSYLTNKKEILFDIDFFTSENTPAFQMNIFKKIANIGNDEGNAPMALPGILQKKLKELPNQIKSLVLQNNGNARVRHKWLSIEDNPSKDPYYKACFSFNYRNIKKVEYLAGYEFGVPPEGPFASAAEMAMIRRPVWKTLNANVYASSIGKALFCRLKTYSKPEYGIMPVECLKMPIFDEFFILEPSPYDGSFPQTPDIPDLPIVDVSIADTEPEDYSSSEFSVYAPGLDKMGEVALGSVITDRNNNPDNPINGPFSGLNMGGFLGGFAGGADVGTGGGGGRAVGGGEWMEQINQEKL